MKELGGTNGLTRRDFLRSGLVFGVGAQALASGYAAVPDVFARAMLSAKSAAVQNDRVLVMIQLGGGNDGLQTVIPITSSSYRDMRPQLSAAAAKAQAITKDLGLRFDPRLGDRRPRAPAAGRLARRGHREELRLRRAPSRRLRMRHDERSR